MRAGLIPLKAGGRAKRRLAKALSTDDHAMLIRALLEDCLDTCKDVPQVHWSIITDDHEVEKEVRHRDLRIIKDSGGGLNVALQAGIDYVTNEGADSVLILPGDVPLAQAEDLQDVLDTGEISEVVVVPSSDGGTNALFLQLPTEMKPEFGPHSLAAHVAQAHSLGLRCSILDVPRLALDLDTEEDARRILAEGGDGSRTNDVLKELFG